MAQVIHGMPLIPPPYLPLGRLVLGPTPLLHETENNISINNQIFKAIIQDHVFFSSQSSLRSSHNP